MQTDPDRGGTPGPEGRGIVAWLRGRGVWGGDWGLVQDGQTALFKAAYNGHSEVVRTLLGNGADVNKANKVIHAHTRTYTRTDRLT